MGGEINSEESGSWLDRTPPLSAGCDALAAESCLARGLGRVQGATLAEGRCGARARRHSLSSSWCTTGLGEATPLLFLHVPLVRLFRPALRRRLGAPEHCGAKLRIRRARAPASAYGPEGPRDLLKAPRKGAFDNGSGDPNAGEHGLALACLGLTMAV